MKLQTVKAKLPKSVKRIVILKAATPDRLSGDVEQVILPVRRKKKQSKGIVRLCERVMRRVARSNERAAQTYLARHKRSNQKRRDGWIRDLGYNAVRANRKGGRALRLSRLFKG